MNEEATHPPTEPGANGETAPANRQPKAPAWDGPPAPRQPGPPTLPWQTPPLPTTAPQQPNSAPPWQSSPDPVAPPQPPQPGPPTLPWQTAPAPAPAPQWQNSPEPHSAPPWQSFPEPNSAPPAIASWNETSTENSWNTAQQQSSPPAPVPPLRPAPPAKPAKSGGRLAGWIGGILVAAIAFGVGGYFIGSAGDSGGGSDNPTSDPAPSVPLFEARLTATNREKLGGDLAGLAGPWITSLGNCIANTEKGAPALGPDESRHVTCRYGDAWVHFVVYKAAAQKNAARSYRLQLNLNADEVAPGVQDPQRTNGGVTQAPGKIVEYAFRQQSGVALCGMSWERDEDQLAALMLEASCEADLGGNWAVLRDLWQRHS
ncbi:hypothetical protein [Actinoplanes palleronii]|uniref:Serine/threonine protein kinase n=1 Tax=Actinoplanes palleronii TaxID=113570 RepID=A0ABQ4B294_9ACTN|nr:hypothetical protein [Actinoplanes palleronii]GIE64784.1 hypothetical protein Apa02nite_008920 [Actinoplanes palleronii]